MKSFFEDFVFLFALLYAAIVFYFIWRNILFLDVSFSRPFYVGSLLLPTQQLLFYVSLNSVSVCWQVVIIGGQL